MGNGIAYPETKPEILILGRDDLNRSVWKHELVRFDIINRKSILVRLPGIAFFRAYLSKENGRTGRQLTTTKRKASNADA
jgi:hypothetical protein